MGLGNFQNSSIRYLLQPGEIQRADLVIDARKVAHNTYLQAAAETGIPGVLLYLGVVGAALACFWRAAQLFAQQGDEELEILTRALMIGLIGLLVGLVFISEGYMKQLWLLLGMGPAVLAIANARDRSAA